MGFFGTTDTTSPLPPLSAAVPTTPTPAYGDLGWVPPLPPSLIRRRPEHLSRKSVTFLDPRSEPSASMTSSLLSPSGAFRLESLFFKLLHLFCVQLCLFGGFFLLAFCVHALGALALADPR